MRFLLQPDVRSSRGRGPGEYSGILFRGPLRASQPGSSVSGVRGHSGLLGGKEARGEEPREEWGQLVHELEDSRGRERTGQGSVKSPGPALRTPELGAAGRRGGKLAGSATRGPGAG